MKDIKALILNVIFPRCEMWRERDRERELKI
jgi:hypothetical protein